MKLDKHNYVPLTRQLIKIIEWRILNDIYPVGESLPSQAQFSEEFDVSLITARNAFKELSKRGVIATHKGKSTQVLKRPEDNDRLYHTIQGFTADKGRLAANSIVLKIEMSKKGPKQVREILELANHEYLVYIERKRMIGDVGIAWETSWLNQSLVPNIDWKRQLRDGVSLYALIDKFSNLRIQMAEENIDAVLCTEEISKNVDAKIDVPLLSVERRTFDKKEPRPFEYSKYFIVPKFYGCIRFTKE